MSTSGAVTERDWTEQQGQYLAFIYMYTVVNGRPPAEADMQRLFCVTPPSVHRMVIELAERGLLKRVPGQSRSLEVLIDPELLPRLQVQPITTTVAGY